jgi:selenium metabolism protein YedF
MESRILDTRGMACPMPVINTKKALEAMKQGSVTTIVDNDTARKNVVALARSMYCEVDVQQKKDEFYIHITKKESSLHMEEHETGDNLFLVSSSVFGRGSEELGAVLMKSLMFSLVENEVMPQTIVFANSGVKLACEGSAVLEHLMIMEKRGVEILLCGTCLEYYKLKEKLCVGQVTNMYTILEKMTNSNKVITI